MFEMKKITLIFATLLAAALFTTASAQHTVGLLGGAGYATARLYPKQEMKPIIGGTNFGLSWRYYGIEERHYKYYTRTRNTIMLPIVWQPHVYLAKNHIRAYVEAAFTLSYNFGGEWEYDNRPDHGKYDWRLERDNRWNYGLAGGAGFALLFGRIEAGVRARYYFGYADVMRNRNKYYDNSTDGLENPFRLTPLRSPIDNINVSITLAYRLSKDGFKEWSYKPKKMSRTRDFSFQQSKRK